jgi:hypothetical protein
MEGIQSLPAPAFCNHGGVQETPPKRWLLVVLFAAYAVATLVLTLHHEPWRDEADSWLVARDLPLPDVLSWTQHSGTPFLWYTLLLPFARAGFPFATQSMLHLVIVLAAAAVFLAQAPFSITTKALFLFSFYPLYEYGAIARNYALAILLTFGLLALHRRREQHLVAYALLVALLPNANAHSIGIAAPMILLFAIEVVTRRRSELRYWGALAIMCGGMLLSFVQLRSAAQHVISAPWDGAFFEAASRAFIPSMSNGWTTLWAIAFLVVLVVAIRRNAAALTLLVCSLSTLAIIFTYVWIAGFRHYGLVLVAVIATLWLAERTPGLVPAMVMLNLSLLASIPAAMRFGVSDLRANFSASKEMAGYLARNGLESEEIAAHQPAQCEAVLPHLRRKSFWYAALGENGSYMKWDKRYRIGQVTRTDAASMAAAQHFGDREWLFLSTSPLPHPEQQQLTLLYATHEPLMETIDADGRPIDERYWLYRHGR